MSAQLINRAWLASDATRTLIAALDAAGIDFRFVGGVVRDSLLGRAVADIDVATPALPQDVVRALKAAGLKAVPTGIAHGTVTAVTRGQPFEITTLRRDVETDGRHAVVAFTDDWRQDAARRDFTMNALYADRDGAVTDFFNGVADLEAGHVRFIGDPVRRIDEDALRILRFFRFHARYGKGPLDGDGLAACKAKAGMIDGLSGERVRTEILKLLIAPEPAPVWEAMVETGIAIHVLASATRVGDLARMTVLEETLGLEPDPLRRLAALTGPLSPDRAKQIKTRLKLSNAQGDHLRALGGSSERAAKVAAREYGPALYGAHAPSILGAAMLAHVASGRPDLATLADFARYAEDWREPRFPLSGADLEAVGIPPGPEMGRQLKQIEDWWIAAGFPDRAACLARLGRGKTAGDQTSDTRA